LAFVCLRTGGSSELLAYVAVNVWVPKNDCSYYQLFAVFLLMTLLSDVILAVFCYLCVLTPWSWAILERLVGFQEIARLYTGQL